MKVLITPHDIAGQMGILAQGLRTFGIEARSVQLAISLAIFGSRLMRRSTWEHRINVS